MFDLTYIQETQPFSFNETPVCFWLGDSLRDGTQKEKNNRKYIERSARHGKNTNEAKQPGSQRQLITRRASEIREPFFRGFPQGRTKENQSDTSPPKLYFGLVRGERGGYETPIPPQTPPNFLCRPPYYPISNTGVYNNPILNLK